eukprot:10744050-Alexandrium_andersonii.AAC.1
MASAGAAAGFVDAFGRGRPPLQPGLCHRNQAGSVYSQELIYSMLGWFILHLGYMLDTAAASA